jgi:hypothetical protein
VSSRAEFGALPRQMQSKDLQFRSQNSATNFSLIKLANLQLVWSMTKGNSKRRFPSGMTNKVFRE